MLARRSKASCAARGCNLHKAWLASRRNSPPGGIRDRLRGRRLSRLAARRPLLIQDGDGPSGGPRAAVRAPATGNAGGHGSAAGVGRARGDPRATGGVGARGREVIDGFKRLRVALDLRFEAVPVMLLEVHVPRGRARLDPGPQPEGSDPHGARRGPGDPGPRGGGQAHARRSANASATTRASARGAFAWRGTSTRRSSRR